MKKYLFSILIIFFFTSLSAQWGNINVPSTGNLLHAAFPTNDTGYVIGNKVFKTSNAGVSFDSIAIPPITQYIRADFKSTNVGLVSGWVSTTPILFRTIDGGINWSTIPIPSTSSAPRQLLMNDTNDFYYASNNGFYKTSDGGNNWSSTSFPFNIMSMAFPTPDTGYIAGGTSTYYVGKIYKTVDGGTTWNIVHDFVSTFTPIKQIQFISADTGFACDILIGSFVRRTTDGGITWNNIPVNAVVESFVFVDYMTGYVATVNHEILKTTNGGTSWIIDFTYANGHDVNEFEMTPSFVYVAGSNGLAARTGYPSGIPTSEENKQLSVFPNPGNEYVTIALPNSTEVVSISAIDITGRNCGILPFSTGNANEISLDAQALSPGFYVLEIVGKNERFKVKFEKSR